MAFDINVPPTPTGGSVLGWGLWAVRAQAAVALSFTADAASLVAGVARAAADVLAGTDERHASS